MDHSIPTSSFNLDIHVPGGEIYELPMTSKLNAGIFTQCLLKKLLEECRPMANTAKGSHAHGEYPGPPQPHAYTCIQSLNLFFMTFFHGQSYFQIQKQPVTLIRLSFLSIILQMV